jgi:hypothetical protein
MAKRLNITKSKRIKFINHPKITNLRIIDITIEGDTSNNIIFDGENVIFDGEQVKAQES